MLCTRGSSYGLTPFGCYPNVLFARESRNTHQMSVPAPCAQAPQRPPEAQLISGIASYPRHRLGFQRGGKISRLQGVLSSERGKKGKERQDREKAGQGGRVEGTERDLWQSMSFQFLTGGEDSS